MLEERLRPSAPQSEDVTKLDWEVWTALIAPDSAQSQDLIQRLAQWMDSTPSRMPTTEWYDTLTGKRH